MRDRLIHDYCGGDYDLVWDVVRSQIPRLRKEVEDVLREEGGSLNNLSRASKVI